MAKLRCRDKKNMLDNLGGSLVIKRVLVRLKKETEESEQITEQK